VARSERAARILETRLEQLAAAAERAGPAGETLLRRRIELALGATQHAVEMELLSDAEAAEIWAEAERRHPALARFDRAFLH
jgi:hypothetical protein